MWGRSSFTFQTKIQNKHETKIANYQEQTPEQIRKPATEAPAPIGAAKAGDLIGMDVVDPQGEKLGSVKEIAVDVESGRIVQVIISSGGFLGIGSSETAVPPGALVHDAENGRLQLDADKERLKGAPPFDTSKWSEAFTTERLAAVYKHYGQESSLDFVDGADQGGESFTIPESRLDGVQGASKITGMTVENLQNMTVGDVEEILLDLPAGRITAMVVASGEYLGIEDELSAIPASAFHFSTDRKTLLLDTSKAALEAAPHFKANRWPDFTRAETVGAIFAAHEVEPYFLSGSATHSRATVGGSQVGGTPATQSENPADMAITSAIQREIRALEDISPNARNVTVVTNEGRTTLSGSVDTAEEKQIVAEISSRINQEAGVENLLVIKIAKTASASE